MEMPSTLAEWLPITAFAVFAVWFCCGLKKLGEAAPPRMPWIWPLLKFVLKGGAICVMLVPLGLVLPAPPAWLPWAVILYFLMRPRGLLARRE